MSLLSRKLNASFNDYESLGAKQTISLVVELDGPLNILALRDHIARLKEQFSEINFLPTLNIVQAVPSLNLVAKIFSNGNVNNPLEFHLVGENNKFFLVCLYHHSFCDGLGGLEVFRRIVEPKIENVSAREHEALELFKRQEKDSFSLLNGLKTGIKQIGARNLLGVNNLSYALDQERRIEIISRPIKEIRELKQKLGCSLNELYLYSVSQILRSLFLESKNHTALVPVNLRPRGLKTTLGNFILVVPVRLPSEIEFKLDSFKEISSSLESKENLSAYRSAISLVLRLPRFVKLPILSKLASLSTCIATYVPDSITKRDLCGAKIVKEFGMPALLPGHKIGFCLITTKDEFSLGITTAGDLIDQGVKARAAFESIFENLSSHETFSL